MTAPWLLIDIGAANSSRFEFPGLAGEVAPGIVEGGLGVGFGANKVPHRRVITCNPEISSIPKRDDIEALTKEDNFESLLDDGDENNNFFDYYKEEKDLDEIENYYTDKAKVDEIILESYKNIDNPAIYLTNIEEIPTPDDHPHPESTLKNEIEQLIQTDTLNQEQKKEAILILKKYSRLFTTRLDQLEYTADIQHKINTKEA
ncbi:489_t:CDS:2, partial [Cetraspora pellucida]